MGVLVRRSLLLVVSSCALWAAPLSAAAAPSKPLLSSWAKAKHAKALAPANAPPPRSPARSKSAGPSVSGKLAVFGFKGDGAARVQQAVVSTLRTRGLQVTTSLRPVDTAEQYREMAATLRLAAYIDGSVAPAGSRAEATVQVRSGITGRRIASIRFSGERSGLPADVADGLWPRVGAQLARLCAEAAKPHKRGRGALRINAGTPVEASAPDDSDIPAHLRNDPKDPPKDDPWGNEGT